MLLNWRKQNHVSGFGLSWNFSSWDHRINEHYSCLLLYYYIALFIKIISKNCALCNYSSQINGNKMKNKETMLWLLHHVLHQLRRISIIKSSVSCLSCMAVASDVDTVLDCKLDWVYWRRPAKSNFLGNIVGILPAQRKVNYTANSWFAYLHAQTFQNFVSRQSSDLKLAKMVISSSVFDCSCTVQYTGEFVSSCLSITQPLVGTWYSRKTALI